MSSHGRIGTLNSAPSHSTPSSSTPATSSTDASTSLHQRVEQLVDEQLLPNATAVDRSGVLPVANFEAIAELRLFGMTVPAETGGLGLSPSENRAVLRRLSSGCGVTAFAFAQHHGATAAVAGTANESLRQSWLPRLVANTLAGTAFAHVRRSGPPALSAEASVDGWLLSGTAPWFTSWGQADVMSVAAVTSDGHMVWALLPAAEHGGLTVRKHFDLMVLGSTQTVELGFDRLVVAEDAVLGIEDHAAWLRRDRLLAARPSPLCLGIGDRALSELRLLDPGTAASFEPWWGDVAARGEEQCRSAEEFLRAKSSDEAEREALIAATALVRADVLTATQRLSTALLAVAGGAGVESAHTAQRLCREALFYVIQAQSADGKAATLSRLRPTP